MSLQSLPVSGLCDRVDAEIKGGTRENFEAKDHKRV